MFKVVSINESLSFSASLFIFNKNYCIYDWYCFMVFVFVQFVNKWKLWIVSYHSWTKTHTKRKHDLFRIPSYDYLFGGFTTKVRKIKIFVYVFETAFYKLITAIFNLTFTYSYCSHRTAQKWWHIIIMATKMMIHLFFFHT